MAGRPRKFKRKACKECGKECKRHTATFCSTACVGTWRRKNKIKVGGLPKRPRHKCLVCGKECKRSTTKFCSKTCESSFGRTELICQQCGKKTILKKSVAARRKYCSPKCQGLAQRGKQLSLEHRQLLSELASKRNAEGVYTNAKGGIRNDIGHYVRSKWEANIARLLIYENIEYEFEKHWFKLKKPDGSTTTYRPDFKIRGRFIEVKGWWNSRSIMLRELMEQQYPEITIEYIDNNIYKELQAYYYDVIQEWEHDWRK